MYLANQHELPTPKGGDTGGNTPWRLHFEYTIETKGEAEAHAAVCRGRHLRVATNENGEPLRRRKTVAVLSASDEKLQEVMRVSGATACSWTDTFNKETGRRTALERLETRLKAGGEGQLSAKDGKRLAQAARHAYDKRPHYNPLREALDLLKRVEEEDAKGQVGDVTRTEIERFLKQFNG